MTLSSPSNYEKRPVVGVPGFSDECWQGWDALTGELGRAAKAIRAERGRCLVAVECYTGLLEEEVQGQLRHGLAADHFLGTADLLLPPDVIDTVVAPFLGGDDPIFGYLSPLTMEAFLDPDKVSAFRARVAALTGVVVVYGPGASLCVEPDLLVYADMPRWEGQLRQRRDEVTNLGVLNHTLKGSLQYKRSYFVDWRVCDRLKRATLPRWDYLLDTTVPGHPRLVTGRALRTGLELAARRPLRVVPFFDPAPWGGQWMKEVCDLDRSKPNYGWCFDCVPEENSLLLGFGGTVVEMPSLNLVFHQPRQLLGDTVYGLFGPEFPIRFDFLDTVGGGNLSLQVHPLVEYAQDQFGIHYTQHESYYLLDAGPGATVYLGLMEGADPRAFFTALETAQAGGAPFPAEQFVNRWPAKKHDHFLIPAGTLHCSGSEAMVLEISATPYIFTFKLWDWGRLGLDGLPRPINIRHGRQVLQTDRDTSWVRDSLVGQVTEVAQGDGWREERTGLHSLEFIETHRHWFTGTVPHDTGGTVNVLNLVEGAEAIVESPSGAFEPYVVHYAETFIIPASVGSYTIRPHGPSQGKECATIKAYARCGA